MQSTYVPGDTPTSSCTMWTGAVQSRGYGSTTNGKGGSMLAHRKAWEAVNGPIPPGLTIDHLCRVRLCVNPEHMEVVTTAENTRRANAAKTHCKQGHPLSGDNLATTVKADGRERRVCIECRRAAVRRAYYAAKERGEDPNAAMKARRSEARRVARQARAGVHEAPPAGFEPATSSTGS